MDADQYQTLAMRTETPGRERNERMLNAALGLCGEAGEFADTLKKALFHGHDLDETELRKELGDVLWYVAQVATEADLDLDVIAGANLEKLLSRQERGVLQGSGDER
jgi:NTP pyrophosphatase (non-canonical NTP hydrolase)